jgi:membrane fusion protein, heavy metal efflux system
MKKILFSASILMLLLTSCGNQTTSDHGHEHTASALEPLAYTLYTQNLELFVEFKPLVVGSTSKFAAHFTVLGENFTALNEGVISVHLIVSDSIINHTVDSASSPGIFRLSLAPTIAGVGKLVFNIETVNFNDTIVIEGVRVYTNAKEAMADQTEDGGGSDITYLKEQAWKVEFANAPVKRKPFNDIIKTSGQILPAPGDERVVVSNASGIVLFSGNKSIVGSSVNVGASLFTIAAGGITEGNIDAAYNDTKANYEKAKQDFERSQELAKQKVISQKDFLDVKLIYDNAQIVFNTISKNYSSAGQGISSPITGYVKNIFVSEGQYVSAGAPLATISQNKKLMLQANVSQKYFGKIAAITSANFQTPGSNEVYSTQKMNGRVISYGKSIAPNSPFIPITFEIDNRGAIIPGAIAEIYLVSSAIANALVVPISALIEEQGNFFVYVQTEGESFQKREVTLGASDGIYVQVLSGVAEGERVVTKGAYQIKLSTASGTLPAHGHEH